MEEDTAGKKMIEQAYKQYGTNAYFNYHGKDYFINRVEIRDDLGDLLMPRYEYIGVNKDGLVRVNEDVLSEILYVGHIEDMVSIKVHETEFVLPRKNLRTFALHQAQDRNIVHTGIVDNDTAVEFLKTIGVEVC